jgi:hypothetical protein
LSAHFNYKDVFFEPFLMSYIILSKTLKFREYKILV